MSQPFSRSDVLLETGDSPSPARVVEPDTPFRILVLGDFSGRANRGLRSSLAGRRPRQVDVDNLDEVMAEFGTTLRLPQVALRFEGLEDFHPDRIYERAELFRTLAQMRTAPPRDPAPEAPAAASPVFTGNLLDNIVGEAEKSSPGAVVEGQGDLAEFIRRAMRPHLVDRPDKRREAWAAQVDATAGEQMRALLHHPDFQALEAAWRAVWLLVQRLEADSELRVYLLDATLEEMVADPDAVDRLAAGAEPWGAIVGNFTFAPQSAQDLARLAVLGRLARRAGAPLLAEAQPPDGSEAPAWEALRHSPLAGSIGLALPRFLLRLPYGRQTSPVDAFAFEEMPASVHHEYLWGNPAFCCALLLGLAFRRDGWDLRPGSIRRVEGLPLHLYREDGEEHLKPCAEVLLRESDAEFLMDNGCMPLASLKDEDAVLLVRFQSIADPPAGLAGQWR
jgi:type VI secretion system protein ImpC